MSLVITVITMSIVFSLDFILVREEKCKTEKILYCTLMLASLVVLVLRSFDVDLPSFTKHIIQLLSSLQ